MLVIERSELKQLPRLFRSSSFLSSGQYGSVSEMQEPLHLLTDDHFYSRHLRAQRGIHSELSAQGAELCCSYFHFIPFLHDDASATSHLASCWQGRPWHHQRWGISWHPFSCSEISSCLFSSGLSPFSPISNSSPSLQLSRIYYLCWRMQCPFKLALQAKPVGSVSSVLSIVLWMVAVLTDVSLVHPTVFHLNAISGFLLIGLVYCLISVPHLYFIS